MKTTRARWAIVLVAGTSLVACGGSDDGTDDGGGGSSGSTSAQGGGSGKGGASGKAGQGGSGAFAGTSGGSPGGSAGASGKGGSGAGAGGSKAGAGGSGAGAGAGGASAGGAGAGGGGASAGAGGAGAGTGGAGEGGSGAGAGGSGAGAGGSGAGTGGAGAGAGGSSGGAGGPSTTCGAPIAPVDTAGNTENVVGDGTPGSCTDEAFGAAVGKGGVITFNCGGAATIAVKSERLIPKGKSTTIDGGGLITLDGGGSTRILRFDGGDFRKTTDVVTLQHLTLKGGHASGSPIPTAPPPCSQGTDIDGGGGAILVRDGVLHVFDATFEGNEAALTGPDVAGGAINGQGSLGIVVVSSRFLGNKASNGGAIGCLNADLQIYDSELSGNEAAGTGGNTIDQSMCKADFNGGEVGDGGNGGAVSIDGGSDGTDTFCGVTFANNKAGVLGGALFRTPDLGPRQTIFDRSTFDGNHADVGGGALYMHDTKPLSIRASTFSNNDAPGPGAIQADGTELAIENSTFYGNSSTKGLGGGIACFGCTGSVASATFFKNHADGGSGLFGAAIAGNPTLTVNNSLFVDNTSKDCGAPMACQVQGSGAGTLQWPAKHAVCDNPDPGCAGDGTTFADPVLADLADNGGPTKTVLPAGNSPAAGVGKGCPATDQRGQPRKADGCTAGAVELP